MKRTRSLAKRLDLVIIQLPVPSFVGLARHHFVRPVDLAYRRRMLELAEIKKTGMLYDMGMGDGRIVSNSQA
jgi:hypothetical protein